MELTVPFTSNIVEAVAGPGNEDHYHYSPGLTGGEESDRPELADC